MKDGTVRISVYGQLLVSKGKVAEFVTEAGETGFLEVRWKDNKENVSITNGKLKGLLEVRDEIIQGLLNSLDELASSLMKEVKARRSL